MEVVSREFSQGNFTRRKFGWVPENVPEERFLRGSSMGKIPETFCLDIDPIPFDQGPNGACTSNAIVSAYAFLKKKILVPLVEGSSTTNKEN